MQMSKLSELLVMYQGAFVIRGKNIDWKAHIALVLDDFAESQSCIP